MFTGLSSLNFLITRCDENLDVIHISDISASGSKANEDTWSINMMVDAITKEEAVFIKFGFSNLQVHRIETINIIAI